MSESFPPVNETESVSESLPFRDMGTALRVQAMRENILSRDRENILAKIIQENPDSPEGMKAKSEIILAHQKLLIGMARRFEHSGANFEDLCQAGSLGLIRAADCFDPSKGNRFNTFAQWKVLSYMQEHVAEVSYSVRVGKGRREKTITRLLRQALATSESGLTQRHIEVIAESCQTTVREVESIAETSVTRGVSLNQSVSNGTSGDKEMEMIDTIVDDKSPNIVVQSEAMHRSMARVLNDVMGDVLNDRERYVLEARYLRDDPKTLREIGSILDVSPERVRQIVRESLTTLKRVMADRGLSSFDLLPDDFL